MKWLIKIFYKIKDIFSHHCPKCGGVMEVEMLDSEIDKLVYKCKKCGEEWF